jgi:putative sigma-54 modulation protein
VFDKLRAKIRKYKSKLQDHHAIGRAIVEMKVNVLKNLAEDEFNDDIEKENLDYAEKAYQPHEIVREETRPLKTLQQDEAIMKIELSGDQFLIYRSEEDRKIKVIYRMKDQNFGLIEVE